MSIDLNLWGFRYYNQKDISEIKHKNYISKLDFGSCNNYIPNPTQLLGNRYRTVNFSKDWALLALGFLSSSVRRYHANYFYVFSPLLKHVF